MYEYTFHPLEIMATDDLPAGEVIQIAPDSLFEMLGELSVRSTLDADDATQHIVFVKIPLVPVEAEC